MREAERQENHRPLRLLPLTKSPAHLHADQLVAPDIHVPDLVVDDRGEVQRREFLLLVCQVLEAEEGTV